MSKQNDNETLQAETSWLHVFRAMIDSGDVARMGTHAVTCYLVIKSYTNWSTGKSFPAIETIAEKSGISLAQVKRPLKTLEEHGYVTKTKAGRRRSRNTGRHSKPRRTPGRRQAVPFRRRRDRRLSEEPGVER